MGPCMRNRKPDFQENQTRMRTFLETSLPKPHGRKIRWVNSEKPGTEPVFIFRENEPEKKFFDPGSSILADDSWGYGSLREWWETNGKETTGRYSGKKSGLQKEFDQRLNLMKCTLVSEAPGHFRVVLFFLKRRSTGILRSGKSCRNEYLSAWVLPVITVKPFRSLSPWLMILLLYFHAFLFFFVVDVFCWRRKMWEPETTFQWAIHGDSNGTIGMSIEISYVGWMELVSSVVYSSQIERDFIRERILNTLVCSSHFSRFYHHASSLMMYHLGIRLTGRWFFKIWKLV